MKTLEQKLHRTLPQSLHLKHRKLILILQVEVQDSVEEVALVMEELMEVMVRGVKVDVALEEMYQNINSVHGHLHLELAEKNYDYNHDYFCGGGGGWRGCSCR